ncbi:MAG: hypothetical protein QOE93_2327, partial [Actinomycetota bacterium]|nr:hypothetical protein [Actinomycetota bacterium]
PPVTGAPPPELVEKGNQQSALQITLDLCAVYRDIGMNIAPLPETRPAESGKAGPEVPGGTSGSGDGSVRLVEHTATPPPAEGVLATPLIGPGAVLVSRAGTGTSYSGGPGGTSYGENYPSHANGSGGALDARVPRGEITGSLLGGPGGAPQSGFDGSSAFTPGGGVHSGGSTVGRGKSADSKPADSKPAGGKAADGKSAGSELAGGIPVSPGAFPVWAESVRPVLGQRRTVQAVPESEVDGVLGRRSLPGETAVDGVLGRSPAAGTPPDQRRRVAAGLPKTESEPKERLKEGGDKQARPVTVSGDTVVSRAEAAPATPAEHAVAGGAPPASVPPASALPALPASAGSAGNAAAAAADAIARLAPSGQPLFAERGAHLPDPGSGGSAAPGGVPQAVLPVRALPAEGSSALAGGYPTIAGLAGSPGSGAAAGIPPSTGGAPMEGAPMSPMMGAGGMGGQQQEDTERTSEIVPGPDPDVWDYSHGAPAALGRPNQPPAEQEKYESPDEIMARILERRS